MALPNILKNFNVFNDGQSFMGMIDEIKLPNVSRKFEDYQGGGMDGSVGIDMGMDKMEMEQTCSGFVAAAYSGFGLTKASGALIRFAGACQRDDTGEVTAVEIVARGRHQAIEHSDAKIGDKGKTTIKSRLTYYKLTVAGEVVMEVDLLGFTFVVKGKDMLADQRAAIGL